MNYLLIFLEWLMIGAALGAALMFILILLTANKSSDDES
jgi:hypothetical protein